MRELLKYLKDYKKEAILGPLFKLIEACFELTVPLIMKRIIDVGIYNGNRAYVVKMCLVMVALGVCGLLFSVTAQYFAAKASIGAATRMRSRLFAHVETMSYTELDEIGTSGLLTRLSGDVNQVQSGLNLALRLLLRSPFVVFGAMIMAFTIDVKSASTFAVVIPLLSIVVFGIMIITMPMYKRVQGNLDKITLRVRENLTGVRVLRAFGMEEDERQAFRRQNETLVEAQRKVSRISALMNPVTYAIINIGIAALIYRGALQVSGGKLEQGDVVALYNYMSLILVELIKLASLIITLTKSWASGKRISETLAVKPSMAYQKTAPVESNSSPIIEFDNVSLRYKNSGADALSNISFSLSRGESLGVIGGTGSGKTSLVSLIPRFYDVSEGSVKVCGVNVQDYPKETLRKKIGIVPQKAALFSGNVRENLCMGKNVSDDELLSALDTAVAKDFVLEKDGLETKIMEGGKNFSGGQKQRLTVARALVGRPEILILDDSASALDYATDAAMRKRIGELEYSPTVVIVSQRTDSIINADHILVLDDGECVGYGTHTELLETCPVYREIYESQQGGGES